MPRLHDRPIYVESRIRAPIEALWNATQDPTLHQRWDVRFGRIEYLPREPNKPQGFIYSTTVAPGVTISGTGESLGDRDRADGSLWSGLRFWANDRRSIIHSGGGYWRYIPTEDGVRFLTRYDYRSRWGFVGKAVDRLLFRPLFGWATAWSFDRLRIWLEEGISPERTRNQAVAHAAAVVGLVGVWLYQGIVPKLWQLDAEEVGVYIGLGVSLETAKILVRFIGTVEVAFGLVSGWFRNKRWPFILTIIAMPITAVGAAIADASLFTRAFNPVSLNWAIMALAVVALATRGGLPSGRQPLRVAPDTQPEVENLP